MSAQKVLKEGYLQKVRSGGWGTNKRWFVLCREVGSSIHSLMYFQNEAARKTNFSQPSVVYAVKQIKLVKARDRDDPKNVGVSIYFKTNTVLPSSPSKDDKESKEKEGAEGEKPAEQASTKEAASGEKTFLLLEADNKLEADAWIAALLKAHGDEGNIPQNQLLQEETDRLREARAVKEKKAEEMAKIEGELRKLKQSNKLGIGAWQTRFFSLDAEFFSYYKSNKKGEPLGFFPVNQMVCVGTSPLQEETCFFFRLPATFSAGEGKYLKSGAPVSPTAAAPTSDAEGEEQKGEAKPGDAKGKDPIILLRCTTTAERDRWIQAFVDLGVKKAHSKDKPAEHAPKEAKEAKVSETPKKEATAAEKTELAVVTSSSSSSSSDDGAIAKQSFSSALESPRRASIHDD